MAAPTSIAARLAAAIDARDRLIRGVMAVEVQIAGGMMTKFTPANREALESYISELQAEISGKPVRRAIGVIF